MSAARDRRAIVAIVNGVERRPTIAARTTLVDCRRDEWRVTRVHAATPRAILGRVAPTVDDLLEQLRRALSQGPPLRLAILFGSGARGALRDDSDLDLGILPSDPELSLTDELGLQVLAERTCRRPVDVVRLDRASTLLRWEAARHAVCVLADPPTAFSRFLAAAAIEHADLMETLGPAAERFRRRLLRSESPASPRIGPAHSD